MYSVVDLLSFPCIFQVSSSCLHFISLCTLDLDLLRPSLPTWLELPGTGRTKCIFVRKRNASLTSFDILLKHSVRSAVETNIDKQHFTVGQSVVSKISWKMWSLKTHPTGSFRGFGVRFSVASIHLM